MAAAVLTIAAMVVLHTQGDESVLGTLVLFAPRRFVPWAWLAMALLVAPITRRWALAALVGAGVSAVWLAGYVVPAWPAPATDVQAASAAPPLRLVTYNVDYATGLTLSLAAARGRWMADVILLQACGDEAAESLASATGVDDGFNPRLRTVRMGEFCVASRYPLQVRAVIGETKLDSRGWTPRPVGLHLRVARPTDTINVVVVHFGSPRVALSNALGGDMSRMQDMVTLRDREAVLLTRYLARIDGPLVVAGDLNTIEESRIYQRHFASFGNAFRDTRYGFGYTMAAGIHKLRVDHVLTGPRMQALSLEVESDWPTEHHPVIAELRIR